MTGRRDAAPLFARKGAEPARIAATVARNPARIQSILEGLGAKDARTRYGCAKVFRIISEKQPAVLYPHFDFFIGLLGSENKILQWNSAWILAGLARVDSHRKFDQVFDSYFAPISGPVMITAANLIGAAARIAEARPDLADRIAVALMRVEKGSYQTSECRNIALGHAIQSFERFFHLIEDKEPVARLIKRQLENSRPATRKKAERFLRKHGEDVA